MTQTPTVPALLDAAAVRAAVPPRAAVDALEEVLRGGFDPEHDAPRTRVATPAGKLLQMPSAAGDLVGVKLLTLTPDNPSRDLPTIQGLYVLFGGAGQSPRAVLDGAAVTDVRTPAVSALGDALARRGARSAGTDDDATPGSGAGLASGAERGEDPARLTVVFGTGVQAWAHLETFAGLGRLGEVRVVGRRADAVDALCTRAREGLGLDARPGTAADVAEADLVLCCTASAEPLFDGALVPSEAVVVAMGSHTPDARELDDALLRRAWVLVESRDSALREAGDVVLALASGALGSPEELVTFADVVQGRAVRPAGVPAVVKTTGMPWQDLAVAAAAVGVG